MEGFKHKYTFYQWMEYLKHKEYISELTNWIANRNQDDKRN